jgi:biopolymer transport protein TolQ
MQPDHAATPSKALDPIALMLGASGVVLTVLVILMVAATLVWLIWFLKFAQLSRLRGSLRAFERASENVPRGADLVALAERHRASPGGRVVLAVARRQESNAASASSSDLLSAVARRAVATEQQRAMVLMPTLSSIASAAPFIGLFGTVWGIMDAFLRIGVEKSASLPVVAPAIGEALIATAFGLVAAIPATIGYNYVDSRIGEMIDELNASADVWVETLAEAERAPTGYPRR